MIYILHASLVISVTAFICVWWVRRCKHDWVVLKEVRLRHELDLLPCGTKYVMQCKKCGVIKKKEV